MDKITHREIWLAGIAALLMACLLFAPAFMGGKLIYSGDLTGSDLTELNLPRRVMAAQAVLQGEMPMWDKRIGCGFPLFAEGQAGTLFPTTLPLFMALPAAAAYNWSIFITLGLAFWGMYLCGRAHHASRLAAIVGALGFAFGSVFIFRLKHLNMIQVSCLLPWSLLALHYLAQSALLRPRSWLRTALWSSLGLAVVWWLQILAGHPHMLAVCLIGDIIYALGLAVTLHGDMPWLKSWKTWWRRLGMAVIIAIGAGLLSLGLGAVQITSTLELTSLSSRGTDQSLQSISNYPFRLQHLRGLFSPFSNINPAQKGVPQNVKEEGVFWDCTPYNGASVPITIIAALLLAIFVHYISALRDADSSEPSDQAINPHICRRRSLYLAGALCLLCFWMALGPQFGLYYAAWKIIPGFAMFRFPCRFIMLAQAFMALWCTLSCDYIIHTLEKQGCGRWGRSVISLLIVLNMGELVYVNNNYNSYLPSSALEPPQSILHLGQHEGRVASPASGFSWQKALLKTGWKNHEQTVIAQNESLPADLCALWDVCNYSDRAVFEGGSDIIRHVALHAVALSDYRIVSAPSTGEAPDSSLHCVDKLLFGATAFKLLQIQGVDRFVSQFPVEFAPVSEKEVQILSQPRNREDVQAYRPYIYAINGYLPRIHLVNIALPEMDNDLHTVQFMLSPTFNPLTMAVLSPNPGSQTGPNSDGHTHQVASGALSAEEFAQASSCHMLGETNTSREIEVSTPQGGYLILGENWYPCWAAYIDGKPADIYKADFAYMGVQVPEGVHQVKFIFEPHSLRRGLIITIVSLLLAVSLALYNMFRFK